jgi:hypothetical protein
MWCSHASLAAPSGNWLCLPCTCVNWESKFGEPMSWSALGTLLENVAKRSNVLHGRNSKFTTHCFRCGAQYRFMWADLKWSLKADKWWDGWSSNENVSCVKCYSYPTNKYQGGNPHVLSSWRVDGVRRGILRYYDWGPRYWSPPEIHGEDETAPISKADLLKFETPILAKIQGVVSGTRNIVC